MSDQRLCPRGTFTHVVAAAYTRQTSALRGTADALLDSVTPPPTVPGGAALSRPIRRRRASGWVSGPPNPTPNFSFKVVGGPTVARHRDSSSPHGRARPAGDGCGPVTATGNRDKK
jgi:hypothetical protein